MSGTGSLGAGIVVLVKGCCVVMLVILVILAYWCLF